MPLAVIHAYEMSEDFSGGRSEQRFGNRFIRRTHSAKVVGQNGGDSAGARRHPEPELVVVIERLAGNQISIIVVGVRMGYRRDWILWEHRSTSWKKRLESRLQAEFGVPPSGGVWSPAFRRRLESRLQAEFGVPPSGGAFRLPNQTA